MNNENIEIKNTNKKSRRFTCGDIHGSYLALVQVLERCGFDYDNDELITIGDIADGWPDVYNVVEELLKIKNRIDIVGNHDDWFLDFINFGVHPDSWSQGGLGTAKSYAKAQSRELKVQSTLVTRLRQHPRYNHIVDLIPEDIPKPHQDFFKGQARFYKDDDNNVFVHGGFDKTLTPQLSPRDYVMWDRKLWNQALSAKSTKTKLKFEGDIKNIFIGHTSTLSWGNIEPMDADILWNVDTGGGEPTGKLTIMDVDTKEYWQSDLLGELYPDEINNR